VIKTKNESKVIVNEKLNFTLSATVSLDSTHVRTHERDVIDCLVHDLFGALTPYVLPAALNAVLVSSHGTAECYDVFKFRWVILDST
jgi:phage tail protein X